MRFLKSNPGLRGDEAMRFLYTVARNLCMDEYRKRPCKRLDDAVECKEPVDPYDLAKDILTRVSVRDALGKLSDSDRELLLLRYANEVPVAVIGTLYGVSRFCVHRKIKNAVKEFKKYWMEEWEDGRMCDETKNKDSVKAGL